MLLKFAGTCFSPGNLGLWFQTDLWLRTLVSHSCKQAGGKGLSKRYWAIRCVLGHSSQWGKVLGLEPGLWWGLSQAGVDWLPLIGYICLWFLFQSHYYNRMSNILAKVRVPDRQTGNGREQLECHLCCLSLSRLILLRRRHRTQGLGDREMAMLLGCSTPTFCWEAVPKDFWASWLDFLTAHRRARSLPMKTV